MTLKIYFRFTILFTLFNTIVMFVLAQNTASITGRLMNDKTSLEFVTVTLFSQKDDVNIYEKSATTDSSGIFLFQELSAGNYKVNFNLLGFKKTSIKITINSKTEQLNAGDIFMETDSKELASVNIVTQKNTFKKTPNGLLINAAGNITQAGGTATDLLRNTPTVVVDAEGAITLRGKTPLILINGRNSSIASTDQIPASSIESIEIINNPSAQYDADAEGGIINIKLKKNKQKGTNAALVLGAGMSTKPRVNSTFMLNHKNAKWNYALAYDNRFAKRTRNVKAGRINFDIPNQYYLNQRRADDRLEQLQNMRINIDFMPNANNTFGFEAIGTKEGQDNEESLTNTLLNKTTVFDSKNNRKSLEIAKGKVAELALNYSHQYANKRKLLTANISTSFNKYTENTAITSQSLSETNDSINQAFFQKTFNDENTNVTNLKTDFVQPISSHAVIETGYKGIFRSLDANFQRLNNVNGIFIPNLLESNIFTFREQIHAGYIQYKAHVGEANNPIWQYDIGLRAEQVTNNGNTAGNQIKFNNNYFNFFPTLNVAYFPKDNEFWKMSYSRRINRPGLWQLNPFIDITDSLNQHSGNPYLKPELVNSFEFGYNKDWEKFSIISSIYYRIANNSIRSFTTLFPNGVAMSKPSNFGNISTYGIENIFTAKPIRNYDVNLSVSLFQQNIQDGSSGMEVNNNVFSWYGKIINNIVLWKESKLQITGVYNAPIALPQGKRIAVYNVDLGFQQKVGKGNARLGLVVTDIFNTQKSGQVLNASNFYYNRIAKVDTRAVLVTFACSFGGIFKEKLLENKFSND